MARRVHYVGGMMTKHRALEVLSEERVRSANEAEQCTPSRLLEALDRAGAFPSEATLAEISDVAEQALALEVRLARQGGVADDWRNIALRLASACRAAGLVKP